MGVRVLRRLVERGELVRCLVRDPRRLGPARMQVGLALGDLADPASLRNALRGVRTVLHLAATTRDQPRASIEEINALATWRLARAAEAAAVEHLVLLSSLGASPHARARVLRSRALAERAVRDSALPRTTVLSAALTYAPGGVLLQRLERLALLPVVPLAGRGDAPQQPIWAEDVAAAVVAAADRGPGGPEHARHDVAGPETMTQRELAERVLRAAGRERPLVPVPAGALRAGLRAAEVLTGPAAVATWEGAELLDVPMLSPSGTAGAQALGIVPRPLAEVLAG